ncbi:MAG: hypothetical protein IJI20_07430 [Firmicutes bacterium]|nr:hypothetical protein [Bacillota bacterium]
MDSNQFKGRKGQKRLREINGRIDQLLQATEPQYIDSEELSYILRSLPDPLVRLYFAEAYNKLDRYWSGMKDYGFLRLCQWWISRNNLTELNRAQVDAMFNRILPAMERQMIRKQESADGSNDNRQ